MLREASPASRSPLVRFVEEHRFPSSLVISHIRRATRGGPALRNTHPFQRELGGRVHVFAHNGELPGLEEQPWLRIGSRRPVGETGSELAFCALLARLEALWLEGAPSLSTRVEIITQFAAELRELGPANFLYSDGEHLFAHSHRRRQSDDGPATPPGLHMIQRTCPCERHHGARGVEIGDCGEPQRVLLIASVPLTDEAWEPLAEGTVLATQAGEVVARSAGA
jgi:glutamine amidotransferase